MSDLDGTPLDDAWKDIVPPPRSSEPDPEVAKARKLQEAADCYRRRKARREHPRGYFDRQQRWFPYEAEYLDCCHSIRTPSARFPYSLMVHCRTVAHVAGLYKVDPEELRRYLKPPKVKTSNPNRRLRGPTIWDKLTEDDSP